VAKSASENDLHGEETLDQSWSEDGSGAPDETLMDRPGKLPSAQQFAKSRNQENGKDSQKIKVVACILDPNKGDFPKCFSRFRTAT
jgi:hypothetical protein